MFNSWRINVYKDRSGQWRWRLLAKNGRKVGASSESFEKRKGALENLFLVTGVQISPYRGQRGGIWSRYDVLGFRSYVK